MVTKNAFKHWDNELDKIAGYIIDDELEPLQKEVYNKLRHTEIIIEFSCKCLYDGERPLSKKDYGRLKFTENQIWQHKINVANKRTKSEDEAFQRGCRRLQIGKGLYPFGIRESEAIEKYPEIKKYYETGRYKRGGFVDKYIANIHHI